MAADQEGDALKRSSPPRQGGTRQPGFRRPNSSCRQPCSRGAKRLLASLSEGRKIRYSRTNPHLTSEMRSETESDISRSDDPLVLALLITVAQEVCTAISAGEVVISGLDAQGFRGLAGAGQAPRASSAAQHDSRFSAERLKAGEVVILGDADGASGNPPSTAGSAPVSAMAIPIVANGSVVGALEVFFATPSAISAEDVSPLEKMADFLGPILARSAPAQAMAASATLGSIQTQTSLPAETRPRPQPTRTPDNREERVVPPPVAVAQGPPVLSPAGELESSAGEKSWPAAPAPEAAAMPRVASFPIVDRNETESRPEVAFGDDQARQLTTEPDQARTRDNKGILIVAVAAGFLVLAAGSASYLRITSSPARSDLKAAASQPPASAVVTPSPAKGGTPKRATFPAEVTLALPTVTVPAHTSRHSTATSTQPVAVSTALPVYPEAAKAQHVEGDVLLDAVVDVNGRVTEAKAVSGPPLLQQAAVDALRQWKYRAATIQGKPVPMHLSVTIRFRAK